MDKNIFNRIRSLRNLQKDPWDVYDLLKEIIEKNKMHSIFFFLLRIRSYQYIRV